MGFPRHLVSLNHLDAFAMVRPPMEFKRLEVLQQQRLEEVGKYLYDIRQRQGIPLEEVEEYTKIQKSQLMAIEQGNLKRLPPGVYIQGFIKKYAAFLGCNAHELASTFPIEEP